MKQPNWTTLLLGESPSRIKIILVLAGGTTLALFTGLLSTPFHLRYLFGAVFAFDIGAGWVSKLFPSTAASWRKAAPWARIVFVILHVTLYPLAVFFLLSGSLAMPYLLAILFLKVGAFCWHVFLRDNEHNNR